MKYDYLVVGAGFTGATFARQKAMQGFKVHVIDKRNHIGGNAYDWRNDDGLLIHQYGPHIFHTNSEKVWDWLSQYTGWIKYEHKVLANLGGGNMPDRVPLPFNFRSIDLCFESWQARALKESLAAMRTRENQRFTLGQLMKSSDHQVIGLAMYIHEHVFKHYTQKMWEMNLEQLGPTVADRVPIIAGYDSRYFADKYQALPIVGYTKLFERILEHGNITVETGVEYVHDMEPIGTKVLHTGPIDEYFDFSEGKLPYRGIKFTFDEDVELKSMAGAATLNYTFPETPYTRTTSMRILNGLQTNSHDVLVTERPNNEERFYPYSHAEARALYATYDHAAQGIADRVRFAGRLGSYQYLNMDQAVAQGLKLAEEF